MTCSALCLFVVVCVSAAALPLHAQSLRDRIEDVRQRRAAAEYEDEQVRSIRAKLRDLITGVHIDAAPARQAFADWSRSTTIPLVIDWNALRAEGVDPDTPITLTLDAVPAEQLLRLMLRQASTDTAELMHEVTPWYVQVLTKRQANRQTVLRVYDVSDLVMAVPHFDDAPSFDLAETLSNRDAGSSASLFRDDSDRRDRHETTRTERGEQLAQLIRDTLEPAIWQAHGGPHASIRYHHGRLIVNAPRYVHRQIAGDPHPTSRPTTATPTPPKHPISARGPRSTPVAGVQR